MAYLLTLSRMILGGVFVASSYTKILYPRHFAESLVTYDLISPSIVTVVALTLGWLELLAGLVVLLGYRSRGGALVLGGLSGIFLIAVTSVLWRGLDISCGCFVGVEWSRVDTRHLVLNALMIAQAVVLYLYGPGRWALNDGECKFLLKIVHKSNPNPTENSAWF